MIRNLLYGPERIAHPNYVQTRSMVIEPDLVLDMADLMREQSGHATLLVNPLQDSGQVETLPLEELSSAAAWQLARLRLAADADANGVVVDLRTGEQPTIISNGKDDDLMKQLADLLDAEGRPRLHWQRYVDTLPWLFVTALVVPSQDVGSGRDVLT